jgi:hypothetical protein
MSVSREYGTIATPWGREMVSAVGRISLWGGIIMFSQNFMKNIKGALMIKRKKIRATWGGTCPLFYSTGSSVEGSTGILYRVLQKLC